MGAAFMRNRHWWYRSLYDDYVGREMRLAFALGAIIWVPHYAYGAYLNRRVEESYANKIYSQEWGPRRNRLTHSMIFEQFEQVLESWQELEVEYQKKGRGMLENK